MTATRMPWVRVSRSLLPLALVLGACGPGDPDRIVRGVPVVAANYARDFRLTDDRGHARSLADYRGRATLVFFGFAQCPDVCPTELARAVEAKRLLGEDGARLQVVFVTVDPERDTQDILHQYVTTFDPSFVALRGDLAATKSTADEFRVLYRKVPTGEPAANSYTMDHTAISYLFDPQGRLRVLVKPTAPAADVAADVRIVLQARSRDRDPS